VGYVTVAKQAEIPAGQMRSVEVGQCLILIINESGQFYALQGLCAHQGLPLAGGTVWRGVLDCPWHHFQYDIRTGENLYPQRVYPLNALPRLRQQVNPLKTYSVRIVDQEIQVELPGNCITQE
jgi:3-phenylpropionate/trans-cinnamate dioxygenase ferredoxin component